MIPFFKKELKIGSYSFIHTNFKKRLHVFTILSFVHSKIFLNILFSIL
ncbi:hypothetical protein LEP1GSC059_3073 [Leptospira noguchii serovar Panama str. CZ214]|uniref:Uncharacterized protein n=1 Tax=Leptospira noguchii serovar Panama str. CZ214 TaxID=1001595 RepID=T0GUP1_9LEPT|nr:hypothetical protein LEP1GSC059_3073 [Leptospira noguchii serovar Panama str. CZ214]